MPRPDEHLPFLDPERNNDFIRQFKPIGMKCEASTCQNANCKDYKRLPNEQFKGWEDEPISICELHSIGHQLLTTP